MRGWVQVPGSLGDPFIYPALRDDKAGMGRDEGPGYAPLPPSARKQPLGRSRSEQPPGHHQAPILFILRMLVGTC